MNSSLSRANFSLAAGEEWEGCAISALDIRRQLAAGKSRMVQILAGWGKLSRGELSREELSREGSMAKLRSNGWCETPAATELPAVLHRLGKLRHRQRVQHIVFG